jgi:hypothetical protein
VSDPVEYVHPREWRRFVRAEARRCGWTPRRMRRYLRRIGRAYCDPWRVPLPVVRCTECRGDWSTLFMAAERGEESTR